MEERFGGGTGDAGTVGERLLWRRTSDPLTDRIAETLRQWADFGRQRAIAAVFQAARAGRYGPPRAVLGGR